MKKKIRMSAMMAVALLVLPLFSVTALAASEESLSAQDVPEETIIIEETLPEEEPPVVSEVEPVPVTGGYDPDAPTEPSVNPFTPSGTGTVIDTATDADGKQFYTIMTPDEHVFYLVIDKQRSTENVYFLNAVTVADLMALAEFPEQPQDGVATTTPPATTTEPPAKETPAEPEPTAANNTGMYIIIGILVVIGGGAGWYFKIYRPKQQGAASGEEYEPPAYDDNDYLDDWDDEQEDDNPPWDDDSEGRYE